MKHGVEARGLKAKSIDLTDATEESKSKEKTWLLMPGGRLLSKWDPLVIAALWFTAMVTPYEVALLETELNPLFFVNRAIDCIFLVDMGPR